MLINDEKTRESETSHFEDRKLVAHCREKKRGVMLSINTECSQQM